MHGDYNRVQSLTAEQFGKLTPGPGELGNATAYTKSDAADVRKMERVLDLQDGALAHDSYYLEKTTCAGCGRVLTMYDFVCTGLIDAGHSKSFILHTFVGEKYVVNRARRVRCSACGTMTAAFCKYWMDRYGCQHKMDEPLE